MLVGSWSLNSHLCTVFDIVCASFMSTSTSAQWMVNESSCSWLLPIVCLISICQHRRSRKHCWIVGIWSAKSPWFSKCAAQGCSAGPSPKCGCTWHEHRVWAQRCTKKSFIKAIKKRYVGIRYLGFIWSKMEKVRESNETVHKQTNHPRQ